MTELGRGFGPSHLQVKWGWFVGIGILLLICGAVALVNLIAATVVSVYYVGMLMVIGGILSIAHGFQVKGWESAILWALGGALYVLAGVFAFLNPILASAALTLMLAAALIVTGVVRVIVGLRMKGVSGGGWIVFAGVVTALAGVVIAIGWPVNSMWILGAFLAIDLLMQGWSLLFLGLALRRAGG